MCVLYVIKYGILCSGINTWETHFVSFFTKEIKWFTSSCHLQQDQSFMNHLSTPDSFLVCFVCLVGTSFMDFSCWSNWFAEGLTTLFPAPGLTIDTIWFIGLAAVVHNFYQIRHIWQEFCFFGLFQFISPFIWWNVQSFFIAKQGFFNLKDKDNRMMIIIIPV